MLQVAINNYNLFVASVSHGQKVHSVIQEFAKTHVEVGLFIS